MCNLFDLTDGLPPNKGKKRKASSLCGSDDVYIPRKRISPLLNTLKEKDSKREVLDLSIQKMRSIENAELCLRKSVLINNTMKRLHSELEKDKNNHRYNSWYLVDKPRHDSILDTFNSRCISNSFLIDDLILRGDEDKISDDMTDTLVGNLEHSLGVKISSVSSMQGELNDCDSLLDFLPNSNRSSCSEHSTMVSKCVFNDYLTSCTSRLTTCLSEHSEPDSFVTSSLQICLSVT